MARSLMAAVLLLVLGVAGWSVWRQLDQPVRTVRVEGALSDAEQRAIREVVAASMDAGVLSLDMDLLRNQIRALSWPRSVQVRRAWPDGLRIRVEKESVVARWGDGGFLTSAGKVVQLAGGDLDSSAISGDSLPTLRTRLSAPRRAMEVYQMLDSLAAVDGLSIARLEEDALGEWQASMDGGMTVMLGRESLSRRMNRFLVTYQQVLAGHPGNADHVDARYDNGVAVHWRATAEARSGSLDGYPEQRMEATYALR